MSMPQRAYLLDVTRLVASRWARRHSTGIDRVAEAYLAHFRTRALAVVQHRGLVRVLKARDSETLFDLLTEPVRRFRLKFAQWSAKAVFHAVPGSDIEGWTYLNPGHTDFDLDAHHNWAARSRLRSIYFIHDLIPILQPDLTRARAVERHSGRVAKALARSHAIVVSSRSVERELHDFAQTSGLAVPPVLVAPLGIGRPGQCSPPSPSPLPTRGNARCTAPFFLAVGTLEPRRNFDLLLDVWGKLAAKSGSRIPRLVIVGQQGRLSEAFGARLTRECDLHEHIEWINDCDDARLTELYARAQALVMPSRAEGFGLPLVEALGQGTPVIASDIPIFREIGQQAPLLLDPCDLDLWVEAIEDFTNNPAQRARQASMARSFEPPQWSAHFALLETWLASLRQLPNAPQHSSMMPCPSF